MVKDLGLVETKTGKPPKSKNKDPKGNKNNNKSEKADKASKKDKGSKSQRSKGLRSKGPRVKKGKAPCKSASAADAQVAPDARPSGKRSKKA